MKEGGERKRRKSQDKEEEGATDGVCLLMLSRTAAVNWVLAETDLLSDYTKERSQQRDSQVEQTPLGLR